MLSRSILFILSIPGVLSFDLAFAQAAPDVWNLLHTENGGRVLGYQPLQVDPESGRRSETFRLELPPGSCAVLGTSIGFPMVIEDLAPLLHVKSNRAKITVGAQIVLPRSIHPQTGRPITFLLEGTNYSGSGDWEKLGFWDKRGVPNFLHEVDKVAPLLRAELGLNLDLREKYVRRLIVYVDGDPSQTVQAELRIGLPDVFGRVETKADYRARYEQTPDGHADSRFDPINFVGFQTKVGSPCVYIGRFTAQSSVGYTEWESPLNRRPSTPLVATPVSGASPPYSGRFQERSLFSQDAERRFQLTSSAIEPSPASLMRIQFSERVLFVNDIPIGVRAVEYQGEPLAFLRRLEFNTVWVQGRATPELLQEAKDAGVWLICSPPSPAELQSASLYENPAPGRTERSAFLTTPLIDPIYDNVLAWNLGDECAGGHFKTDAPRVTSLQNADRSRRRPILCTARSGVREYSRIVDVLMMRRKPLLSSLEPANLARWQQTYQNLARPDTPFWGTIQTDPDPKLAEQWNLFGGNDQDLCAISHEQIKTQVYQALAAGNHGLMFTSNTPLTNNDPATEYRRTSLELINWELQLIEHWFAAGRDRPTRIKSNHPSVSSAVIPAGRTRLLVPLWEESDSQFAVGPAVAGRVHYIVSGIPETYSAYHLVPGRLFPMDTKRVAGGMRLALDEANLNSLIYFGEVDALYAQVGERAKTIGPRAAYLACRLAELQLASAEQVLSVLKRARENGAIPVHAKDHLPLVSVQEQETLVKMTTETIDGAKRLMQQSPPDYASAYLQAEKATRGIRFVGRQLLREATRHDLNPCMTPVSVCFATLPLYLGAYQRAYGARLGENRLPCGDMENVDFWQQVGWDSRLHRIDGVAPPVLRISPDARRSGRNGLQMIVRPTSPEEKPGQLETAPVWVVSPPGVRIRMGELICVNGWIRIPRQLESTADGLMILDSLGGEALALRFLDTPKKTPESFAEPPETAPETTTGPETGAAGDIPPEWEPGSWREFAFYRYAPADMDYHIVFLLHGFGEVHIDDVRIAAVQFETAPAPPASTPAPAAPTPWQRLNPFQYLPPLPSWGGP